jgi:hypothetical protein
VQNDPDHPDNQAFVVSHVGLNNEARWNEFRELDLDDQELVQSWLHGEPDGGSGEPGEGHPRRFDSGMLVNDEIISHFIDQEYLDPEDDRVLEELLAQRVAGGLAIGDLISRDQLRDRLRARRDAASDETPESIPVTPQRRRRAARTRLAERTGSVVNRVLSDVGIARAGRDVARIGLARGGLANLQAVTKLLNDEINAFLGIPSRSRGTLTADQTAAALENLDDLGDVVRDRILRAMEGTN